MYLLSLSWNLALKSQHISPATSYCRVKINQGIVNNFLNWFCYFPKTKPASFFIFPSKHLAAIQRQAEGQPLIRAGLRKHLNSGTMGKKPEWLSGFWKRKGFQRRIKAKLSFSEALRTRWQAHEAQLNGCSLTLKSICNMIVGLVDPVSENLLGCIAQEGDLGSSLCC